MVERLKVYNAAEFARRPIPPRRERGKTLVEHVKGAALDPSLSATWWVGRQWAVTAYGLEALDGRYLIEKARLTERVDTWSWPTHMGDKAWVDIEDFITAWLVAMTMHGARMPAEAIHKAIALTAPREA